MPRSIKADGIKNNSHDSHGFDEVVLAAKDARHFSRYHFAYHKFIAFTET